MAVKVTVRMHDQDGTSYVAVDDAVLWLWLLAVSALDAGEDRVAAVLNAVADQLAKSRLPVGL